MLLRTGKKNYHQIGINMIPDIAFPYKPPPENTKKKHVYIFDLQKSPKIRFSKLTFEKLFALVLTFSLPIIILLKLSHKYLIHD